MSDLSLLLEAAAEALSDRFGPVALGEPRLLTSSDRNRVVRAEVGKEGSAGLPSSVIIKAAVGPDPGRESAALAVLGQRRIAGAPTVLADLPGLLVMADAGTGPSLADRLQGRDPEAATAAVLTWAETIGRLQSASTDLGAEFEQALAERSPLGPPPADLSADALADDAGALAAHLPRVGVDPSAAAIEAVRSLLDDLEGPCALDPGDPCPDNNVETDAGLVLLDFEWAEFRHVGWAAAYLRVPWPTCWCSWRLPPEVAAAALARWRAALGPRAPDEATLELLTAAWALRTVGAFLPRALDGDPPSPDPRRTRPSFRALIQHRLATVAGAPVPSVVAELAAESLAACRRAWGDRSVPLAPAWAGGPAPPVNGGARFPPADGEAKA